MAGSFEEFKSIEEVENYCNSKNLSIVKVDKDFIKVAKLLNKNGIEMAYLTTSDRAYASSLKEDTKWIIVLD